MKVMIFKYAVLIPFLLTGIISISAQDYYSAATISPDMIKNACAVIRLQEETLDIKSVSSATYSFRRIVTVLNEDGLFLSVFTGAEDKFSSLHFDKITIYDKTGKKVKSFGTSHLKPYSPYSINIFDDNYYFYVDPEYLTYPFTAEINYSIDYKGIFGLPEWHHYDYYSVSTEKSIFAVTFPAGYKLRHYDYKSPGEEKMKQEGTSITYQWEKSNLPAIIKESYSVSLAEHSPAVLLAPSDFEIGGRPGSFESWESFGRFISVLNKDRNLIEGETVNKVREIVASTSDTVEIIRKLYKYMQNKTRYVSVQIGMGGWQPIVAQAVDNTSYGDCKALSNYMKSLLDLAGIKSNYTLVLAGSSTDDIVGNFPSIQFNHAILSVPRGSDTIWLECTSQKQPFNYLGDFTDDRDVILITDDSGKKVKTPKYSADQNKQSRRATIALDPAGNATASVSTEYNYVFFDDNVSLLYMDHEGQKKTLTNNINIPGFTLTDFSVKQKDPDMPVINEDLSLKLNKYATIIGERMLIPVNLMNRSGRLPSNTADRKMDIEFRRDRTVVDTITYKLPVGYAVTTVPQPMEYKSPFGHYRAEVTVNDKELTYVREMRYFKGTFPASQYAELVEFYKNIATADNTKIALKKL